MRRTGISHENGLFLGDMVALSKGFTRVDGVLKVETAADRVPFNDLVAHDEVCVQTIDQRLMDETELYSTYKAYGEKQEAKGVKGNERPGYY
jgi:hypothetical protein